MKEHEVDMLEAGLTAGLTANFLVKQYDLAHKLELGRMACDLDDKNFSSKQATASIVDKMLDSSITLSIKEFASYQPTPSMLEDESRLSTLSSFQIEKTDCCYFTKVRLYNLLDMTRKFADYTELAHTLELYSQSSEGSADGCNTFQRKQKMKAIRGFEEGKISDTEIQDAQDRMLYLANVDKDGNSKEGPLTIKITIKITIKK